MIRLIAVQKYGKKSNNHLEYIKNLMFACTFYPFYLELSFFFTYFATKFENR